MEQRLATEALVLSDAASVQLRQWDLLEPLS